MVSALHASVHFKPELATALHPQTSLVSLRQDLQDKLLQLVLRLYVQAALCEPQLSMHPPDVWGIYQNSIDLQCTQILVNTHRTISEFN